MLFAQGNQQLFLCCHLGTTRLQLGVLPDLLAGEFTLSGRKGFNLLPPAEAGLRALPVLAKFGQCLSGESLILLGQGFFKRAVCGGFCLFCRVDRKLLCCNLAGKCCQ